MIKKIFPALSGREEKGSKKRVVRNIFEALAQVQSTAHRVGVCFERSRACTARCTRVWWAWLDARVFFVHTYMLRGKCRKNTHHTYSYTPRKHHDALHPEPKRAEHPFITVGDTPK